jgi:hypothetical protein
LWTGRGGTVGIVSARRISSADGAPRIRYRSPVDRRSRAQRWHSAAELIALQDDYRTWLNALPQNLEESATAEPMRTICDLDLSYIESVERGEALVATDAKIAGRLPGSSSSRAR